MTEDKTQTPDLSEKIIDNPSDPFGFKAAIDRSYEQGINHCIQLINVAITYPVEGIKGQFINKENVINSLNNLINKNQ